MNWLSKGPACGVTTPGSSPIWHLSIQIVARFRSGPVRAVSEGGEVNSGIFSSTHSPEMCGATIDFGVPENHEAEKTRTCNHVNKINITSTFLALLTPRLRSSARSLFKGSSHQSKCSPVPCWPQIGPSNIPPKQMSAPGPQSLASARCPTSSTMRAKNGRHRLGFLHSEYRTDRTRG